MYNAVSSIILSLFPLFDCSTTFLAIACIYSPGFEYPLPNFIDSSKNQLLDPDPFFLSYCFAIISLICIYVYEKENISKFIFSTRSHEIL